ncbi:MULTISPECIES: PIN domain-containing protein [Bradyrhizobium]|uniref:PIN domain-containing protein n=1 Tax=Bradyrhizobium TaxID=374 RepID=UPI001EDAC911|nr:PIN domain-containing protein [Bradyrhizobium zhengyangense]MCG2642572.1 PIN domain-containing protein [Bradyrhizobium zhengyangense]
MSPTFTVVLDANVWVAERLLQSSLGNALLYAVAEAKASFGVPEVVEREVNQVLPEMAEVAARNIKRDTTILRQLSGQRLMVTGPTLLAVQEGISQRWKQLSGSIERVPFNFEQANSALSRIMKKTAPCGENNEQFRDCCIWHAALTLGADRPIYLVTADNAFYEGRKVGNSLARVLESETERKGVKILIHPSIRELLTALGGTAVAIDESVIAQAILETISPAARDIVVAGKAPGQGKFELGEPLGWKIKGYATPKPAVVAISFEVAFELDLLAAGNEAWGLEKGQLRIEGECDFDPNQKIISHIEVKNWSQNLGASWGRSTTHSSDLDKQYRPSHMRVLS